jgi:uncharacterized protein (DUF488 family)
MRQKYLYHFLQSTHKCSKMKLAKIFFLFNTEYSMNKPCKLYNFVPYKFGPYSFELFHDIDAMEREKILTTDANHIYFIHDNSLPKIDISDDLNHYLNRLSKLTEKELIKYVYDRHPDYTVFSEIEKKKLLVRDQIGITTIGYEGLSIDEFFMRLIQDKINTLVDIRNNPWSMKYGYTKQTLSTLCEKLGIQYLSTPPLGIPSHLRKNLQTKEDYENLFAHYATYLKTRKEYLDNIIKLSKKQKLALMCFEKDPQLCHRHILAEELKRLGAEVTIR